ncbi:MAG: DUF1156 domain-containing protein [Candidatus Nitrosocaldaceae archaeon]
MELLEIFEKVSEEAKKEKLGRPPINEICYWWTRKPLIVSRALILASTLSTQQLNTKAVDSLLSINKEVRAYTKDPDIYLYKQLLGGKDPSGIKVLDCFAGAGNIIFEAMRFGFSCYAIEYNPVAYLIEKAVLEYPKKYGIKLAEDVEHYGNEVINRTLEELREFYYYYYYSNNNHNSNRKRLTYLYAWCITCPYCKQRIPLLNHMWLANTDKKKIGLRIEPANSNSNSKNNNNNFIVKIVEDISEKEGEEFTHKKDKVICIRCRNTIDYKQMTSDIAKRKDYEMLAVVVKGIKGKDYILASEEDKEALKRAEEELKKRWEEFEDEGLIPNEKIRESGRDANLHSYGFTQWYQVYNPRQLLLLITLLKNIKKIVKEIEDQYGRDYAKVIATYLALLIAKHVDRNCICVGWDVTNEQIAHALAMRSPRIIYNFAEVNPFEKTSGSLHSMLENIVSAIKFASKALTINNTDNNNTLTTILNASALHLSEHFPSNYFDLIITDPPYLDDVAYGEISEFFYVWLYRALKDYYLDPELPSRVPLDEDIVLSKGRFDGDKDLAYRFYKDKLKEAFKEMYKVLKDDGLAVIFFAHSSTEAWNLLLDILRETRFHVKQSYAIHTESTENVLARGKTSFMSSICIACRKLPAGYRREEYIEHIVMNIEDKIKDLIDRLSNNNYKVSSYDRLLSLPITDLLIMIYGKILEEITQYTDIKSFKADFKIDFEHILDYARSSILKLIFEKIMGESPAVLGSEISFYLLLRIFYHSSLDSDEALKLVRALNAELNDLQRKEVITRKKEKNGLKITLLPFNECRNIIKKRDDEIDMTNLHEQLIYIEYIADSKGANAVKRLLELPAFRVTELRKIISLLLNNYKVKTNKNEKLNDDEKKEYGVLATISDILLGDSGGGVHGMARLDNYM